MPLCFEITDLPPEIITHILSFLSHRDLTNVCLSCKMFRDVALQDCIWQQRCREDFNFTNNEGWNASYKDVYAKVLHRFGQTVGLWQAEMSHYGALVHVQFDEGRIIGRQCMAPVAPHVSDALRVKTLFTIQFTQDQEDVEIFCHKGFSDPHKGCLEWKEDGSLLFRCTEVEHHQHPEGKQRTICSVFNKSKLLLMKFLVTTQLGCNYRMSRLARSPRRSPAVIQPGFFKGTYGGHGIEIIQLKYDANGKIVQGIKITGDPNVPATKISFEVDLSQPIILTSEQQGTVALIEQIDIPELPPDTDIQRLPPQAFIVPDDCIDRFQNAPRTCRARFHAKGQIAGHGFSDPSFTVGHWVVFDENMFGFLWLKLRSFSVYSRVLEDLWS
ncbi:F-box only protein 31-like [Gigantopelta aegis]|uniref:F-box only protein 31-like n=1 Tax=Gigantopelta aegis TaxID=1735272 RepID=UPI001B888A3A|nr:F-box only protein 31-like [Gigantopelta aegis]